MSLTLNFNSAAAMAQTNLLNNSNALSNSIEELSSGKRINTAADDPAGLVVANYMQSQASGMDQAIANSNDGINMVKTGEAALNEVSNLLNEARTLAVHAANSGVNSTAEVAADQAALNNITASLDRISSTTQFNGINLLDGTYTAKNLQIGQSATSTQAVTIAASDSTTLGVNALNLSTGAAAAITAIDTAINTISTQRANLGALQTYTLQSNINSLTQASTDTKASEATIRDANMATAMTEFTQNNILTQAATSMLAQANSAPQSILKLITG